jgi:phosphate-selective porin OprO/OprP
MDQFRGCAIAVLAALIVVSPREAAAQDAPQEADAPAVRFRWRNRPSIDIGDVRLDLRLKLSYDGRWFDPEIDEDDHAWRVRRTGINGEIGNHFDFQIERDLNSNGRWRDVYLHWRTYRQIEITAGRFKVPFGREELISISDLDFAFRSLVSNTIPPARDRGVMAAGRFLRRGVTYEFGVFDDDGDNGNLKEQQFSVTGEIKDIGPSFAGRVTATPLRPLAETFQTLRFGFAYGGTNVPEGLNSLRGSSVYGTVDFFEPVYTKGRRTRMGVEVSYTPGPVGFSAEWMQAREERKNQGLGDVDLSDVISTGWYAGATWLITGEDKEDFNNPDNGLFQGGIGAVEVAARYEKLQFESADKTGPAFPNPRAEHLLGNSDAVFTAGVNWFVNRWVRVTVNGIREEFEDPNRTPIPGLTVFWSGLGRLQLVF